MKTLLLFRHGKSDWSLSQPDIMRGLTDGGKKDVALVSLAAKKFLPAQLKILCSAASRTMATAKICCNTLEIALSDVEYRDDLYTFSLSELESVIKSADQKINALLVFGHNEAFTNFVNKYGNVKIDNLPTSGFARISFECDNWRDIENGKTEALLFPKDLKHGN